MPTVPRVTEQGVQEAALPNVRMSPDAPLEAFGGGASLQRLGQAENVLLAGVTDYADHERKIADQAVAMDVNSKYTALETELLHHPKSGALNTMGEASFAVHDKVADEFKKRADEIDKNMVDGDQKANAAKQRQNTWINIDKAVQIHVSDQSRKYYDEKTKSLLTNQQDAAVANYKDPSRIAQSINAQREAIILQAQAHGMSEEAAKAQFEEAQSKTHSMVISRMLARDEDMRAKKYYDTVKDSIVGRDKISVDKALEEGTFRGETQRQSDQIIAKGVDAVQALDAARQIKDPKIRDGVEQRVKSYFAERKAAEEEASNQLYLESSKLLDNKPGLSPSDVRGLIPPDTWSKLRPEHQRALEKRVEDPPNNDKKWLDFLDKSPNDLAAMGRAEFESDYWTHFDAARRSRAEAQWNAAHEGKSKEPPTTNTLTFKDRVDLTLRQTGVIRPDQARGDFSREDAARYARFEQDAAHSVEELEKSKGRKATGDEIQGIMDKMVVQGITEKNWIFPNKKKLVSELKPGEKFIDIEYKAIPRNEVNAIEAALKRAGKPVSEDLVRKMYLRGLNQ